MGGVVIHHQLIVIVTTAVAEGPVVEFPGDLTTEACL